ncbi:MAG TPA: hypothetical protein VGM05_09815, partial [Planctomycetaceae bacterium]
PIWVEIGGKPVRASKKSAEWCLKAVETCWKSKVGSIRAKEKDAAKAAYDRASEIYAAILKEVVED